METLEFRKILAMLDGQIEEAQKAADEKARREALEQHLKLVKHQIENIAARKAQIEKLGVRAAVDLDQVLAKLEAERASFEKQLQAPQEPQAPKVLRLSDADRQDAEALYDEIMKNWGESLEAEERWTQYEIWSTRWRMIVERAGPDIADADGFLKMVYARIRERMKKEPVAGWYIVALEKGKAADWAALLAAAETKLAGLIEARRKQEEAEVALEKSLDEMIHSLLVFRKDATPENERLLRHNVRAAARVDTNREYIADTLKPVRELLEDEFAFLWKNGHESEEEEAPAEPKRIANIEIVMRICRKLNSKKLIGASHAPADKLWKGFPEHDKGRAKEAVDVLVKAGVLRRKTSLIGDRVSLEPKMMGRVEAAIAARPMGIPLVDEWCAADAQKNGNI